AGGHAASSRVRNDRGVTEVDATRAEVREWLAANWDPELPLVEWRTRLVDAGWALPAANAEGVRQELDRVGAVGTPVGVGSGLGVPTLLAHGTDDLQQRFVRPTLTGEITWCQLFSEPGNGSDLAGLTTRATRDGDEWIVNGQKLWSTSAHHADYGLLLART